MMTGSFYILFSLVTYHMYPKYWDTLSPYSTGPNNYGKCPKIYGKCPKNIKCPKI